MKHLLSILPSRCVSSATRYEVKTKGPWFGGRGNPKTVVPTPTRLASRCFARAASGGSERGARGGRTGNLATKHGERPPTFSKPDYILAIIIK